MTNTAQLQSAFESSVLQIRQRFIDRAEQQVMDLDDLMDRIESSTGDRIALETAMNLVHKISGIAATLGFQQIGELAQCAESRLIACTKQSNEAVHALAIAAVEILVAELDRL